MSEEQQKSGHGGEVLQFPAPSTPAESPRNGDEALLNAVLSPIRSTKTRQAIMELTGRNHEKVEAFLCTPELRGRIAACVAAHVTGLVPQALKGFDDALHAGESWAYKLLLDAIGFQRIAEGALSDEREKQDVVISDAFEREIVENIRDFLREKERGAEPGDGGPLGD